MLFGELAKRTKTQRSTLDRYIRLGLIPHETNPENDYREFDGEAVKRVNLIRVLRKRPYKRNLNEIKGIFGRASIQELEIKLKNSKEALLQFLSSKGLL